MEQDNLESQVNEAEVQQSKFTQVTPLSKYLAMILFILMPFIGGWVGYQYATHDGANENSILPSDDLRSEQELGIISNNFHYQTAELGEQYGLMTLEKITSFKTRNDVQPDQPHEKDISATFIGNVTLTGTLSAPTEDPMDGGVGPDYSISSLTEDSLEKIPHSETDNRHIWFGIENPEVIMQSGLKNRDQVEVVVSRYIHNEYPSEVWNMAYILSVKRVEMDKADITKESNSEDTTEIEKVFQKDGRYAPDGRMLDDKDLYEQTGLPYVTTFSKDYALYVLGGIHSFGEAETIYKYDTSTQTYKPLAVNILEISSEINRNGLELLGWSSDWRYLMIGAAHPVRNLYYLDTENLQNGLTKVDELRVTSKVSPDYKKILAVMDEGAEGLHDNLYVFSMDTLTAKKIYSHDSSLATFMDIERYFGEYVINGEWLNNNEIELKITPLDIFNEFHSTLTEESRVKFENAQEVVVVNTDISI